MNINEQFGIAVRHVQMRQFDDAERICRSILTVDPSHIDALHCLGMLASEAGRFREVVELLGKVLAQNDNIAQCHYNIALAHQRLAEPDKAAAHYRRALVLNPNYPQALANLSGILLQNGETRPALDAVMRALGLQDLANARDIYCTLVPLHPDIAARNQGLLARAMAEAWRRPIVFGGAAVAALMSDFILHPMIMRTTNAWPRRVSVQEALGPTKLSAVTDHALLRVLLDNALVTSVGLERFLTVLRTGLLDLAASETEPSPVSDSSLSFFCALARQCFINGYLFSYTGPEFQKAQSLRIALSAALQRGQAVPVLWPAAVAAYFPLHSIEHAELLYSQPAPATLRALLAQQLAEPIEEGRLRKSIPALTAIEDDVSVKVRAQYEEHPYPFWVKLPPPQPPSETNAVKPDHMPERVWRAAENVTDVLIAGCGTGQQPIESALANPNARVLAVDLSRASLAYGQRKANEMGIKNIEFAQADILALGSIDRTFDLITCSGVLHHLRDPWAGWEALLPLLRPDGLMRVGLYSKLARRHINAARRFVAEGGYGSASEDIRQCRQDLSARGDNVLISALTGIPDFFDINSCRDLLFHVQEHQMTMAEIETFLADHDLDFLGFEVGTAILLNFRARHPEASALTDLSRWQAFEIEFPNSFLGMYQFVVQRAERANRK